MKYISIKIFVVFLLSLGASGLPAQEAILSANSNATGSAGTNATYSYSNYYDDTDGGDGSDSWFGTGIKGAGSTGGKRGSYSYNTVHDLPGTSNIGSVTGCSEDSQCNILNVLQGLERPYINDRVLTSKPGKGGAISPYSSNIIPTPGEWVCAIITLFE